MRRDDRGATAVEMAIVLPVFLTLVGGVLTLGFAMVYAGLAEHAARVGLRAATVRTTTGYPDVTRVRTAIDTAVAGLLPTPANPNSTLLVRDPADVSRSARGSQGDRVRVRVQYVVPVVDEAIDLIPNAALQAQFRQLVTVERVAEGRLE